MSNHHSFELVQNYGLRAKKNSTAKSGFERRFYISLRAVMRAINFNLIPVDYGGS